MTNAQMDEVAVEEDGAVEQERAAEGAEPLPKAKLTIVAPGLSFERDILQHEAMSIMRAVVLGEDLTRDLQGGSGVVSGGGGKGSMSTGRERPLSLPEFYRETAPKVNAAKLTTFAQYLNEYRGQDSFTAEDLRACFRMVNEPLPANTSRDLRVAIQSGWLAEEMGDTSQLFITKSGMEAVRSGFAEGTVRRVSKPRRRNRASGMTAEESTTTDASE